MQQDQDSDSRSSLMALIRCRKVGHPTETIRKTRPWALCLAGSSRSLFWRPIRFLFPTERIWFCLASIFSLLRPVIRGHQTGGLVTSSDQAFIPKILDHSSFPCPTLFVQPLYMGFSLGNSIFVQDGGGEARIPRPRKYIDRTTHATICMFVADDNSSRSSHAPAWQHQTAKHD